MDKDIYLAKADIHKLTENEKLELAGQGLLYFVEVDTIEVVLSERNLLSLLAKLYIDGSRRTIYNGDVPKGYVLKLVSEDDETHYADRAPAGRMATSTEELVEAVRETLKGWEDKHKLVKLFKKGANVQDDESAS